MLPYDINVKHKQRPYLVNEAKINMELKINPNQYSRKQPHKIEIIVIDIEIKKIFERTEVPLNVNFGKNWKHDDSYIFVGKFEF